MNFFVLTLLLYTSGAEASGSWDYTVEKGPHTWPGICQSGLRQSPIDIHAKDLFAKPIPQLHFINYDYSGEVTLSNNGHSVVVNGFDKWMKQPQIFGGELKSKYTLAQFHFHWAKIDTEGSEHKVGGLHYPAELHLVHVKDGLSLPEALKQSDGIAVIGVFLSIGFAPEPLSAMANGLDKVLKNGNSTTLSKLLLRNVLPSNTDTFYSYDGSLTTPTCDEAVKWHVLAEPVSITAQQLASFRAIENSRGESSAHNWRPVQPLNGRRVNFRLANAEIFSQRNDATRSGHLSLLLASIGLLAYF